MVRIEKLVLQGFKSFKRKISIPFPPGFSIITGPNGAGKSNIADAIVFVLGKTSARTLRAKKAQELIFHGGNNKPESEYAKVTLYFSNEDKKFPFEDEIVSVSRRINQKGISTYRLNGKVVTRQQILDIFSQAGIRPDGYNIIQQGDVNQIIDMNPIERRGIIDEISGIMEYDEKRQQALKELQKVEEKLREAEIILREKESVLERLKQERDAALEYKKLQGELEKTKMEILFKEFDESEKNLKEIDKEIEEKERALQKLEEEVKKYEQMLEEEESKLESLTSEILQASSQIEITKKIDKLRLRIEREKSRLESNKREIERLEILIDRIKTINTKINPAVNAVKDFKGVHGVLSDLIIVPKEYKIAVEVAGGSHLQDIVVDTTNTAIECVKYLKENKIGRARFLPLDRIKPSPKKSLPPQAIGWLSNLIHHEPKYTNVVEYVFGNTACVKDIEFIKNIKERIKAVSLDGDLLEVSGAITGGHFKSKIKFPEINQYLKSKNSLEKENEKIELILRELNKELEELAEKERKTKTPKLEKEREKINKNLREIREKRKKAYESRLILQQELNKLRIKKAKIEANYENLKIQWESYGLDKNKMKIKEEIQVLKEKEKDLIKKIESLGLVNLKAIEEYEELKDEFDDFEKKVNKIISEKDSIESSLNKIEEKRRETFMETLQEISKHFKQVFNELTNGDGELTLEDPNDIESGLIISASPSGKKLLHIDSMSGGEKSLTALAFLFAIQRYKSAPFYILDESDAALDKVNTKKVADMIKKQSKHSQFIIISHNEALIKEADQVYGVSMEDGESKVIEIDLKSLDGHTEKPLVEGVENA